MSAPRGADADALSARLRGLGVPSARITRLATALAERLAALEVVRSDALESVAPATEFVPAVRRDAEAETPTHAPEPRPTSHRPTPHGVGTLPATLARRRGARDASDALREGRTSAEALLDQALEAIEAHGAELRAFVAIDERGAREQARASDARRRRGVSTSPIDGVIVAVKDVFDVAGLPTGAGSRQRADARSADHDAAVVARARAAGAVFIGKTHTHEFALGGTGENAYLGDARNPWDPSRISGGSSSGSAVAVATGMAHAAIGSDAGGSVRGPAALCGVAGVKPSHGRLPLDGAIPSSWSLDHVGLLAPGVEDAGLVLGALSGDAATDHPPYRTLRIGVPMRYFFDHLAPGVADRVAAAQAALDALGIACVSVDWPDPALTAAADALSWTINAVEAAAYHAPMLGHSPELYGADVRERLELGAAVLAHEYLLAQRMRRAIGSDLAAVWRSVDMLLTPSCPWTAFPHGTAHVEIDGLSLPAAATLNRCLRIANLTGWPALSMFAGLAADGLPVGLQLMAPHGDDASLLSIAVALERAWPSAP